VNLHELYARLHGADPDDARAAARELAGQDVVVVSACLLGEKTRHDGGDKLSPAVVDAVRGRAVLPLCPEILGGMGCPRPPVQFTADGRIVDTAGRDRTAELTRGAERAAELAALAGAKDAILKERSPSCGSKTVHREGRVVTGQGVFAARLHLRVLSEEDI
jgi:uncharacterized protein YbbK (DUF523 family)